MCCVVCRRGGDCEIGAHHHAWETPPCTADDVARHPYASNLPLRAVRAAAGVADDAITEAVGAPPCRTDRAASGSRRHTSSRSNVSGYQVESSVAPLFYEAHKDGPDFVEAPLTPYFLAYDSATRPGHQQPARGAGVGGAQSAAAAAPAVSLCPARRGRTRRSVSCGRCGSRASDGCGLRIRRSRT